MCRLRTRTGARRKSFCLLNLFSLGPRPPSDFARDLVQVFGYLQKFGRARGRRRLAESRGPRAIGTTRAATARAGKLPSAACCGFGRAAGRPHFLERNYFFGAQLFDGRAHAPRVFRVWREPEARSQTRPPPARTRVCASGCRRGSSARGPSRRRAPANRASLKIGAKSV